MLRTFSGDIPNHTPYGSPECQAWVSILKRFSGAQMRMLWLLRTFKQQKEWSRQDCCLNILDTQSIQNSLHFLEEDNLEERGVFSRLYFLPIFLRLWFIASRFREQIQMFIKHRQESRATVHSSAWMVNVTGDVIPVLNSKLGWHLKYHRQYRWSLLVEFFPSLLTTVWMPSPHPS